MFIAMNRFRVKKGSEEAFEKVWLTRETHLDRVPGFVEFHHSKVRTARTTRSTLRTRSGKANQPSRHGPGRRNFAPRTRVPATKPLVRFISSIPNSKASKCGRR